MRDDIHSTTHLLLTPREVISIIYVRCLRSCHSLKLNTETNGYHIKLPSGVPAIRKDSLTGNPDAIRTQEPHNRRDILHHGQTVAHTIGLVEFDGLGGLLRVEESYQGLVRGQQWFRMYGIRTSVHRTGSDVVDTNATGLKLLADTAVIAGLAFSSLSPSIDRGVE